MRISKNMVSVILKVILLCCFSGCALLMGPPVTPVRTFYVLGSELKFSPGGSVQKNTVEIRESLSPPLIDSNRILFSRRVSTLSEYQYAFWAEPPTGRFNQLLRQALAASGGTVPFPGSESTAKGMIVSTQILEFYHDASEPGSQVVVKIAVSMSPDRAAQGAQERIFERKIALEKNDAEHAVQGFDQAVYQIIQEVVDWLNQKQTF